MSDVIQFRCRPAPIVDVPISFQCSRCKYNVDTKLSIATCTGQHLRTTEAVCKSCGKVQAIELDLSPMRDIC